MAKRKRPLKERKKSLSSTYWRNKADAENKRIHTGRPCEVCLTMGIKNTDTCGHHAVERSISAYFRHDQRNMVDLCAAHHKYSNEIAAHSKNLKAVEAFGEWLKKHRPDARECVDTYKKYAGQKVNYKQKYEKLEGL